MKGEDAIEGAIERIIAVSEQDEKEWDDSGWYNGPDGPDWDNSIEQN